MQELAAALPTLSGLIEKAGVIGLLVIACAILVRELLRLRQEYTTELTRLRGELANVYRQRDRARLALVKCQAALDNAGIRVDLSAVADIIGDAQ